MINPYISSQYLDLGREDYRETWSFQKQLHFLRKTNKIDDTFIFVEHVPGVYTIGRGSNKENYPDIDPILIERGGDVTYHGPGQLVIYPIMRAYEENERRDVRGFVNSIENIMIHSMEDMGFHPHLGPEPGIWIYDSPTGNRKVASLGMKIDSGVSYHGVSINYSEESINGFKKIRPCGMDPEVMGYLGVKRDDLRNSIIKELEKNYRGTHKLEKDYFIKMLDNIKMEL